MEFTREEIETLIKNSLVGSTVVAERLGLGYSARCFLTSPSGRRYTVEMVLLSPDNYFYEGEEPKIVVTIQDDEEGVILYEDEHLGLFKEDELENNDYWKGWLKVLDDARRLCTDKKELEVLNTYREDILNAK